MTDTITSADIVRFRKAPKTNAERQKAWRERQRAKKAVTKIEVPAVSEIAVPPAYKADAGGRAGGLGAVRGSQSGQHTGASTPVIDVTPVTPSRFELAPWILRAASIALAGVGLSMNAVYAHSLGSSDLSGWLFLALGVAADASALVLPSVAASARDRVQRAFGWAAFAVVFAFAILASVGFASTSISDVTMARNSRVTPAVTAAQAALSDAQGARDRECRGGVGKFCREREATVAAARQTLEAAWSTLAQSADPQTAALVKIITWASHGTLAPSEGDVGMVRLILFALLPQIGGILMMVARRR